MLYMGWGFAPERSVSLSSPTAAHSAAHSSAPRGSVYSIDGASTASCSSSITKVSPKLVTPNASMR